MNAITHADTAGRVYLVGAGPGAPDLLTLRAARILESADIVFFDDLVHPDTLALATCAQKITVGKRNGRVSTDQRFINRQLVEAARRFRNVVRLKGGDPMLFGRAQEEIDALREHHIAFEVVPGITAALAASASMGVSLTQRGIARSVSFSTPRVGTGESESDWFQASLHTDTAVLYMAAARIAAFATELIQRGKTRHTPAVLVENASLPNERRIFSTLGDLTEFSEAFDGPALVCIGDVFASAASGTSIDAEAKHKDGRADWPENALKGSTVLEFHQSLSVRQRA